jgi:hypothetical protein
MLNWLIKRQIAAFELTYGYDYVRNTLAALRDTDADQRSERASASRSGDGRADLILRPITRFQQYPLPWRPG